MVSIELLLSSQNCEDGVSGKNRWFTEKIEEGRLLYLNREKAAIWERYVGAPLHVENAPEPFLTEKDLADFVSPKKKRYYSTDFIVNQSASEEEAQKPDNAEAAPE